MIGPGPFRGDRLRGLDPFRSYFRLVLVLVLVLVLKLGEVLVTCFRRSCPVLRTARWATADPGAADGLLVVKRGVHEAARSRIAPTPAAPNRLVAFIDWETMPLPLQALLA